MGGSCWSYVVPYAGDVERALRALQADVFAKRAYYDRRAQLRGTLPRMTELFDSMKLSPKDRAKMLAEVQAEIDAPDPTTIAELIERNQESGTHSILDVQGVSAKPKTFRIAPLSDAQLQKLFGSTKPARAAVEAAVSEIWDLRQRWQGTYVLLYDKNGVPTEILFAGVSGD